MEEWEEIPFTKGQYFISTKGRIKSISRPRIMNNGIVKHYRDFILRQIEHSQGYLKVNLYVDKKQYSRLVHQLVAEAFLPKYSDNLVVNHKDGNKKNNRIDNLEWVTQKENSEHASKTGLHYNCRKLIAVKNNKVIYKANFSRSLAEQIIKNTKNHSSIETIARNIRKKVNQDIEYLGFKFLSI